MYSIYKSNLLQMPFKCLTLIVFSDNENTRHKIITYLLLDLRRLLVAYTVLKGLGEEFIFALILE